MFTNGNGTGVPGTRPQNQQQLQGFTQLQEVEKCALGYMKELDDEKVKLNQKLDEILKVEQQYEKGIAEFKSKIAVSKDRLEDLGISKLKNRLTKLEEELEDLKKEEKRLNEQNLQESLNLQKNVATMTLPFQKRRMEFKSIVAVKNGIKTKKVQAGQLAKKLEEEKVQIQNLQERLKRSSTPKWPVRTMEAIAAVRERDLDKYTS